MCQTDRQRYEKALSIPDTAEHVAQAIFAGKPKKNWRFLQEQEEVEIKNPAVRDRT